MKQSLEKEKSYAFALKAIEAYRRLEASKERVLSKQMLRAATSVGANVEEALAGQSRADFLSKMAIASKEARETNYWLRLLRDSKLLDERSTKDLLMGSDELLRMLTSIVKTTQENMRKPGSGKSGE
jgi:four helix bundle protein